MGNTPNNESKNEIMNKNETTEEEKKPFEFSVDDVSNIDLIDCETHYLVPTDLDPEKDDNVVKYYLYQILMVNIHKLLIFHQQIY